jgi:EmrB/QacA subfamily drug resistance transporter
MFAENVSGRRYMAYLIKKYHKWLVLVAMTGSLSMIMIDQTIVTVTLPTIQKQFNVSENTLQWIINSYILALAVSVAVGGRIGDIIGRVKTFIFGMILFCLASVVCGLSVNIEMLIIARAVQGIAAAFMQPASAAIVNLSFELEERGMAMAIYAGVAMGFLCLGPLLGGFFTEYMSWRWAFYINIPVAMLAIFLTKVVQPKDEVVTGQKIDYWGAGLFIIAACSVVLGIQQAGNYGFESIYSLGLIIFGFLFFIIFIVFERITTNPILHFELFKNRNFSLDAVLLFCVQFSSVGQTVFLGLFMQEILGFGAFKTGLWTLLTVIAIVLVAQVSGRLFDKIGLKYPVVCGLFCLVISFFLQAYLIRLQNIYYLIPSMILVGIGVGCISTPANADALNRVGRKQRGQASGLIQTFRQLGGTIGIAVLFFVLNSVQKNMITSLIAKYHLTLNKVDLLYGLLSKSGTEQKTIALNISSNWQNIIIDLKSAFVLGLSDAYLVAGFVSIITFLLVVFFMKSGRQQEEFDVI